jgi:hypothetical protein
MEETIKDKFFKDKLQYKFSKDIIEFWKDRAESYEWLYTEQKKLNDQYRDLLKEYQKKDDGCQEKSGCF